MRSVIGAVLAREPRRLPFRKPGIFAPLFDSTESRMEKNLGTMESNGTLFAIVDGIATSAGEVNWRLYRTARSGKTEDRTEVTRHPALRVWNDPNPFYTQSELVETIIQHYETVGEMWLHGPRSTMATNGPPVELWAIRPDRMAPVPHKTKFAVGYRYSLGDTEIPLRLSDVIYVRRPNPLSAYRGLGPVGSLILDIEGEKAAAEYNVNFFRQGAEPGGVIEATEPLTDPEFEQLVERWNSSHRGVSNSHRVAVLEGAQWKERRYTLRDMQFEQLRRFSKEQIRGAWRFPKPLLGDVEDVNRANAEAAEVVFVRWVLRQRLGRIRELLNFRFLPLFGPLGEGYEFDYDAPVPKNAAEERADERARALSVTGFVNAGFDPAGTLETFGFPPIDWAGPPKDRFAVENADELEEEGEDE